MRLDNGRIIDACGWIRVTKKVHLRISTGSILVYQAASYRNRRLAPALWATWVTYQHTDTRTNNLELARHFLIIIIIYLF